MAYSQTNKKWHLVLFVLGVSLVLSVVSLQADAAEPAKKSGKPFHLEEATIEDVHRAMLAGQLTSTQLVTLYFNRIKAYNGTCVNQPQGILGPVTTIPHARQINALSTLNLRPATRERWGFDARKARSLTDRVDGAPEMLDALETAAAQDRAFARTGRLAGPLHGVVIAIKDQYDTKDMRTTSGGDAPYANDRPPDDATFVAKLRDAGAIILAKANLAEYAVDGARSSFGGTFCNPYDTEREPGMSSAGSGSSVAANLVTCAIGEETVVSVRWPSAVNSIVGLAPTKELVSTDGMIGAGVNMRVGPMCRTVADTARILDAIAGYDPKDPYTAASVGRMPSTSYLDATNARSLTGLRIGVVREYLNRKLLAQADAESVDLVERAIDVLKKLGATVVDPGPDGALFQQCITHSAPELLSSAFTSQYRTDGDQIAALVDMRANPSRVPDALTLRSIGGGFNVTGEDKYMINRYLRERGDANITTNADLIAKGTYYEDPNFPNRKAAREQAERATAFDTSGRMHTRFALQTLLMNCMAEQKLDALVAPMSTVPPRKLLSPREPNSNGRNPIGWFMFGQQGFPAIDVPAGFTTNVWDRERAGNSETKLVGPVPAKLPVGVDFIARPFGEPLLFRIAAAYEAATKNRRPPEDFGPVQ
jgi:Asp-tRNA(Asn)/Glu-tRNA(Gln) amidotransferase A subunit family amidase